MTIQYRIYTRLDCTTQIENTIKYNTHIYYKEIQQFKVGYNTTQYSKVKYSTQSITGYYNKDGSLHHTTVHIIHIIIQDTNTIQLEYNM